MVERFLCTAACSPSGYTLSSPMSARSQRSWRARKCCRRANGVARRMLLRAKKERTVSYQQTLPILLQTSKLKDCGSIMKCFQHTEALSHLWVQKRQLWSEEPFRSLLSSSAYAASLLRGEQPLAQAM